MEQNNSSPNQQSQRPARPGRPAMQNRQSTNYSTQNPSTVQFKEPAYVTEREARGQVPGSSSNADAGPLGDALAPNSGGANFKRKKSLIRPDRERIDPSHRQWYYRNHAANLETDKVGFAPSSTGNIPQMGQRAPGAYAHNGHQNGSSANMSGGGGLRRGVSVLGRDPEAQYETGFGRFRPGTLRRGPKVQPIDKDKQSADPSSTSTWMWYCYIITCCFPSFLLQRCGLDIKEKQRAWREKMGLISIILVIMAAVGFLTFGFTQAVCGKPATRFAAGTIGSSSLIVNGYSYDFDKFKHPGVNASNPFYQIPANSNILYPPVNAGGHDGSLLFQVVNQNCYGLITRTANSPIYGPNGPMTRYFPCKVLSQNGNPTPNFTAQPYDAYGCHAENDARTAFYNTQPEGQVYFSWDQIANSSRNLGVYSNNVLDFDLLKWLNPAEVNYPDFFKELMTANNSYRGRDSTAQFMRSDNKQNAKCLVDIIRVGFLDSQSFGCVASDVVLYVSLVVIAGVVFLKFVLAVIFGWFLSWQLGSFKPESYEERMKRSEQIEVWSEDIYRPADSKPLRRANFLPTSSRFSHTTANVGRPNSTYNNFRRSAAGSTTRLLNSPANASSINAPFARNSMQATPPGSPPLGAQRSSTSLTLKDGLNSRRSSLSEGSMGSCPFPLDNVVPQPPPDFQPFNFPLAHTICLVTAYSESVEGLRTTLDSIATTDYPNSHKMLLVICDGLIKGSGNKLTTPDICLGMMKEFSIPREEVQAHSYVAIADGYKRHNMAKVYAGFYDYDDATVDPSRQQRVPYVIIVKCGSSDESQDPKPGNRGKRDSQIVLMSFLQKVMFDERMTPLEYEMFNGIWRVTGVSPDNFEIVMMVDADTKVYPDSLARMVSCMVNDPEIMGLCGETKIANKTDSWVTMIQVFEYYISHHSQKAFESIFGGVTCLPGCFCMYRIKAPKGPNGYWVPILANPDIVEHYSENVVDTLHKKNLLLLGEDRYLTTIMLRTFPKRKMMFVPQAVCKTVVPDTFHVLLSQRRRWINSTVHNLLELILVRDLCGTFCFSMQFVIFMELVGTVVLPAAISFTLYLIIISTFENPKPIIPLVLLAVILGLPAVLIVLTSRRLAYVGWMLIYLFSLPIWNFVLPTYAYWHFDDFSWGQTRRVEGDKGAHNGDKEGIFDSTRIVMKRWAEWERERRLKMGLAIGAATMQGGLNNNFSTFDIADAGYHGYGRKSGFGYLNSGDNKRHSMGDSGEDSGAMDRSGSRSTGHSQGASTNSSILNANVIHAPQTIYEDHTPTGRHSWQQTPRKLDAVPLLELPGPVSPSRPGAVERLAHVADEHDSSDSSDNHTYVAKSNSSGSGGSGGDRIVHGKDKSLPSAPIEREPSPSSPGEGGFYAPDQILSTEPEDDDVFSSPLQSPVTEHPPTASSGRAPSRGYSLVDEGPTANAKPAQKPLQRPISQVGTGAAGAATGLRRASKPVAGRTPGSRASTVETSSPISPSARGFSPVPPQVPQGARNYSPAPQVATQISSAPRSYSPVTPQVPTQMSSAQRGYSPALPIAPHANAPRSYSPAPASGSTPSYSQFYQAAVANASASAGITPATGPQRYSVVPQNRASYHSQTGTIPSSQAASISQASTPMSGAGPAGSAQAVGAGSGSGAGASPLNTNPRFSTTAPYGEYPFANRPTGQGPPRPESPAQSVISDASISSNRASVGRPQRGPPPSQYRH